MRWDRHSRNVDMLIYCESRHVALVQPHSEVTIFLRTRTIHWRWNNESEEGGFGGSRTWTSSVKHFVEFQETHPCTCHVVCKFQMPLTCSAPQGYDIFLIFFTWWKGRILVSIWTTTLAVRFVGLLFVALLLSKGYL